MKRLFDRHLSITFAPFLVGTLGNVLLSMVSFQYPKQKTGESSYFVSMGSLNLRQSVYLVAMATGAGKYNTFFHIV